jgi:hypothetical protein
METLESTSKCKSVDGNLLDGDLQKHGNSTNNNINLPNVQNDIQQWNKSLLLCQETFEQSNEINVTKKFDEIYQSMNQTNNVSESLNEEIGDHDWTSLLLVAAFCVLIVVTIIGNTLVILSVITTKRLRTVTNCFGESIYFNCLKNGKLCDGNSRNT